MKTIIAGSNEMIGLMPTRGGKVRDWQHWAPYAAIVWSLIYAVLGVYWAVSGRGFPFAPETMSDGLGPLLGRFGPTIGWIVVMMAGIPAAAMGVAMLRGARGKVFRPLLITAGALLTGALLLLMTGLSLLTKFGYIPGVVLGLLTAEKTQAYLTSWTQWATIHQLLCLIGGFLWLAATVCYTRRSGDACLYCGRRDGPEGWTRPEQAAHWGRIAVYVAMVAPVFYAFVRSAWALGFPLGMNEERFLSGQENGVWIGGLSMAVFGIVGVFLMLGLVQRWGEVFPRWMIGLAGRRVSIALAVVPASIISVLLIVGGIGIWSGLNQMVTNLLNSGAKGSEIPSAIAFELAPTLLFPVWGVSLAVATLGYYYRRRGPCNVCGRGTSAEVGEP